MALSKAVMPAMAAAVGRGGLRAARAATRLAPSPPAVMAAMHSRMRDTAQHRGFSAQVETCVQRQPCNVDVGGRLLADPPKAQQFENGDIGVRQVGGM